jgi:hypothetical protein
VFDRCRLVRDGGGGAASDRCNTTFSGKGETHVFRPTERPCRWDAQILESREAALEHRLRAVLGPPSLI